MRDLFILGMRHGLTWVVCEIVDNFQEEVAVVTHSKSWSVRYCEGLIQEVFKGSS